MNRQGRRGRVHVYTGNGKGKTTAALGIALRAASIGMRVAIVAFDKGGDHYSERSIIAARIPEIEFFPSGCDRMDSGTGRFRFGVTDEDRKEGERALSIVRDLFGRPRHDLVILDEVNISTSIGIVDEHVVLDILASRPHGMELVLTGREVPQSFRNLADLITEMAPVAHYFTRGEIARKGIDY
jgi:cob(I)alamin adenosyltransferase